MLEKVGKPHLAIQDFSQAISLYHSCEPHDNRNMSPQREQMAALHNCRGLVYERLEKYKEAIADFSVALFLDANNAEVYRNRGICEVRIGKYDSAVEDYTKARNLLPEMVDILVDRGFALRKLGELERAIKDLTDALQMEPDNVKALSNRAYIYAQQDL